LASKKGRAARILALLSRAYPRAETALVYRDAFQLLVAAMLSARTTDAQVNQVTRGLFARYPTAADLARAETAEVERLIARVGLFRTKARHLVDTARILTERHGGEVPGDRTALMALPGVGYKTAGVVLGVCFGQPTCPVDTHVFRLTHRLGLTAAADPVRVEEELCALVPAGERMAAHLRLIAHGRAVCTARAPRCGRCPLASLCPYPATRAEEVRDG